MLNAFFENSTKNWEKSCLGGWEDPPKWTISNIFEFYLRFFLLFVQWQNVSFKVHFLIIKFHLWAPWIQIKYSKYHRCIFIGPGWEAKYPFPLLKTHTFWNILWKSARFEQYVVTMFPDEVLLTFFKTSPKIKKKVIRGGQEPS